MPGIKFGMDWLDRLNDCDACALSNMVLNGKMPKPTWPQVTQVLDVLLGKHPGRTSSDETFLFAAIGIFITDTLNCYEIYKQCLDQGLGTWVYQWKKPAKDKTVELFAAATGSKPWLR